MSVIVNAPAGLAVPPQNLEPYIGNGSQNVTFSGLGGGSYNTIDVVNPSCRGLILVINITAITGTGPSLTVTAQGKTPASAIYYNILSSAALAAAGTTILRIYPGLTAAANAVANDILPHLWRIGFVIAGTTPSVTASIDALLVV